MVAGKTGALEAGHILPELDRVFTPAFVKRICRVARTTPKSGSKCVRRLRRDVAVRLLRLEERSVCGFAFTCSNGFAARPPELIDAFHAPDGALLGRPDRLAGDADGHRVGVHLREVSQGDPA